MQVLGGGVSHVWKRHLGPLIIRGINMSPCLTAAPLLLEYINNKITQSLASVRQASQHTGLVIRLTREQFGSLGPGPYLLRNFSVRLCCMLLGGGSCWTPPSSNIC